MSGATGDDWLPDVLGKDWLARTLPLEPTSEGEVVATLVARAGVVAPASSADRDRSGRTAVLYIHGFADYFFQTHLAREWEERGIDFFAIDLHGYGRSLLEHQTPNFCTDLREYGEELAAATRVIRDELGYGRLVINGHSTGGLVAALWAHSATGRATVDALVLNSPWLDLNRPWFDRVIGTAVLDVVGRRARYVVVQKGPSEYYRSLRSESRGDWTIDDRYRPLEGTAVLTGWLRAIRAGQARLAAGLDVRCPVLVCCSTESGINHVDNVDLTRVDVVLDVTHIVARAPAIGPDVSVVQIEDGIHDLALSREPARSAYFTAVFEWVGERLGVPAVA